MPKELLSRTLTMRTAVGVSEFEREAGGPGSLGRLLAQIFARLTTVPERRAEIGGRIVEARHVNDADPQGLLLIHLVAYTPDDQVPVVPSAPDAPGADLQLIEAPANT